MIGYIIVFILGAVIGSFLNVCIYRLPRGISIVTPSSMCPSCRRPIKFYDNIPIISYILLRGRCRECGSRISIRYPLVEALNALLFVSVLHRFGPDGPVVLVAYLLFVSSLLVITFIDLDFQIIPDRITIPWIVVSLILGATVLPDPFLGHDPLGFRSSLIGALSGGGLFYLIAIVGRAIFRKDAMGGGDIKLMAVVGGMLGYKGVILTTFIGSLVGSIVGVMVILHNRQGWGVRIPFGPFLALGAIISLLAGQDILHWYLSRPYV